ncbi:CDP-alcohol phosphatidyltransferase family protein [Flavobacterium litorale]|uniref:CDP-alcohol phosphatidyltransferase family protein n=1 Tax=Flavobacterium litorale TaxID=2856519 RepID=A0ABX8V9J5_9FLAO|nr:CDP-alcohol phosphatidyltransferase family protein [Flavobacterium litorale]QYJ67316.1 CDP-alcohol phosphatidyltransferase family protein [Flavobacterium litorale]
MPFSKYIPNFITLLNLFSGLLALICAFNNDFEMAFAFVCLGIFFDFWDGFFARILKVQSEVGLQLDSLADMVTSGVVPGVVMYKMLYTIYDFSGADVSEHLLHYFLPYIGFIITLASCYRLAKFNVDTRQTTSFIGLPTPANALFILSLPLILDDSPNTSIVYNMLMNPYVLMGITALSAYMLNAEIPLFSLKIKQFNFKDNKLQIGFLVLALVLLIILKYLAIPLIIIAYVVLSVINNLFSQQPTE